MKQGRNIQELATELRRINDTKRDFIAPAGRIIMTNEARVALEGADQSLVFNPTGWAHNQLGDWLNIPRAYYDRLRGENAPLLAQNVNWGVKRQADDKRLIRTLDGNVRAMLSNRYRVLDSHDLIEAVMPAIMERGGFRVESCEMTDRRFYLKVFTDRIQEDVKPGDPVQYGLVISSSDVGAGSVRIEPMLYRLVCTNGMVLADSKVRKYHVGREMAAEELREIVGDEARQTADRAFWLSVRDVVAHTMRPEVFEKAVARMRDATQDKITNYDLKEVVERTAKAVGITGEETRQSIIDQLAAGGDLSRWGLANAFTAAANTQADYERASLLERAGGQVIELSPYDWKSCAGKAS